MEIEKEIDITIKFNLDDKDVCKWIEERIDDLDILYNNEAREKMKPIKAKYYEKWMELYWFFQNPISELEGRDPVPESTRKDCKNFFS